MAFSLAIFCVPIANTMVTMELSASGIAATASATANIRESRMGISRYRGQAKDHHTDRQNDDRQFLAEVVQALLQRRLALLGLVHQRGNFADLRMHAGARHHNSGAAIRHKGTGKDHILLVAQGHFLAGDDLLGLFNALRLAGQRAFVHLEGKVLNHAPVCNHQVARFQKTRCRPAPPLWRGPPPLRLHAKPSPLGRTSP